MSSRRGNLQPAHSGYRYQDIATAYMLVRTIVQRYSNVVVDRKIVDNDRIDDLEVVFEGKRVRRQFKSSQNPQRYIAKEDFIAEKSTLRIDRLVLTYVRDAPPAEEYRLCATWQPPEQDDELAGLLEPISAEPTIEHWSSKHYRLLGERIWPFGSNPVWSCLLPDGQPSTEFGRDEFLAFCERFIIELSLPISSTVLNIPGPLELALIEELSERVGIGRYPNQGRRSVDVAALSISLANLARTQEASLTPADVERELGIQTDFGRVAQAFPLEESLFHDRPTFRNTMRQTALSGAHQFVIAPPGAGKSWELTRLADELRAADVIVARHYCYLEPGDEHIERRVTTDVFFGNLLGELVDAAPDLLGANEKRYAAGLAELEAALTKAVIFGRPVVLIIDGLDHIARVRNDVRSLSDDETDIVERLATLNIPEGVGVVIGSQPGQHLDPLRRRWGTKAIECLLPEWRQDDLVALVARHGIVQALSAVGITNDDIGSIQLELANRANGNPLYARYLVRGLVSGLQDGTITTPQDWIADVPIIDGDVAVYYSYLYRTVSKGAQAIADVLGVIDFAVTESDLREILPAFLGSWLPSALASLAPVLTTMTGQGGIRVFHESFRRFMTDELARQGRSSADALQPVIDWLDKRGFYSDAKAYRFLLPALRRAARNAEVLAHISTTFVSESVAQAHPADAIQRNLVLAADVAAYVRDWPSLVRCVELSRSVDTCFDEAQSTWHKYWTAYLQLFGPIALSERLLFDGYPTQSRGYGLIACSLIDDADGNAPWREYLELPDQEVEKSPHMFDKEARLDEEEVVLLASIHGQLRLTSQRRVVGRFFDYLKRSGNSFKPVFIRTIAWRIARMIGPELVEQLASRSDPLHKRGPQITHRAAAVLRLGIADEYVQLGNFSAASIAATCALEGADTPELAVACVVLGAPVEQALQAAANLDLLHIAVDHDDFLHDAHDVRAWVASVRLLACDSAKGSLILEAQRQRVNGEGWYRCWLRFVLGLAGVESARRNGQPGDIIEAFDELKHDVHPFRGKPRACDLYSIEGVIKETIAWGLSLLRSEEEWCKALDTLSIVSSKTASKIDQEDGGPLSIGTMIEVLMTYVSSPIAGSLIRTEIQQYVTRLDLAGSYYSTHAEYAMYLARVMHAQGETSEAHNVWMRGAAYLAGYGWRKDITVFDIIKSVPALLALSQDAALAALVDVQPLANAVIVHTDRRSTKHAPNEWLGSLLQVHPVAAVALLARTITEEDGDGGWPTRQAIHDVAAYTCDIADPMLVDAILATLRFKIETESESDRTAKARLAPIVRLATIDPAMAAESVRHIAAEVIDDGRRHTDNAALRVEATAHELGLTIPRITTAISSSTQHPSSFRSKSHQSKQLWLSALRVPAFPVNPSFVDLLVGLRSRGYALRWDDVGGWDDVILSLSYHLGNLVDNGREDDARRLLRFFARDTLNPMSDSVHPLSKLADALDAGGYPRIAAIAYALSYTSTRGGGGYLRFGDRSHGHLIEKGITLDNEAVKQILADEGAYALRSGGYSIGITRHLIERIAEWEEPNLAEATWRKAFAVIAHRLPLPPPRGWFAPFEYESLPDWTVDESLVALLLARLSVPILAYKTAALAGVVKAIQQRPDAVVKPFRWWLTRNAHVTSVLLVLDALWNAENKPYQVSQALEEVLSGYARSNLWGAQRLAVLLLDRLGIPAPSRSAQASQVSSDTVLTEQRRMALMTADVGDTLGKLEMLWPELPDLVLPRLDHLVDGSKVQIERVRERFSFRNDRDGDAYPSTPVLLWQYELFQDILHDELARINVELGSTGEWTLDDENDLVFAVLPHTELHLGLRASRTVRPAWANPADSTDGLGPLLILGDDDSIFAGWTRLAIWERQYLLDTHGQPTEAVTLYAGAAAIPLGTTIPHNSFPFRDGDADDWWCPAPSPIKFPPYLELGPLVRLTRVTDWLGDAFVLIPPIKLRSYLLLDPPRYGEPLVWKDETGAPAIVLRTWRVQNAKIITISAEPVEYEGTDLIVRPDVIERLRQLCAVAIHEMRVVNRRPISDND